MDRMKFYMKQCETIVRIAMKINEGRHRPHHYGTPVLLYTSEIYIIDLIALQPKINVSEIAKQMGVQKSAIPKVIRKLEDKGMVIRSVPPENRKMVQLELTELGKVAYHGHLAYHERINHDLIEQFMTFSEEEMHFMDRMLSNVEQSMDKILQQPIEKE